MNIKLPLNYGGILPYTINPVVQMALMQEALQNGVHSMQSDPVTANNVYAWITYPICTPTRIVKNPYWWRLDPELEWEWKETPITHLIKDEISKIEHLYTKLTKISLVITKTNYDLLLHKDWVSGNVYNGIKYTKGQNPDAKENILHNQNRNLAIKIPISDLPGNNGNSTFAFNDKQYKYDVGYNFFYMNETDLFHGVYRSPFNRGVIFIDGFLNLDEFDKLEKKNINLETANYELEYLVKNK